MKRIGILMLGFFAILWLPVSIVYAQDYPWPDDPGQLGHYAIGHTSYMFTDTSRSDRPLYFMVWYPADQNSINFSTPLAQYPLDPYTSSVPVSVSTDWESLGYDRAYEGLPVSEHRPFPLVLLSPAFTGDAWQYIFIGTRLASHGYIVAVSEPWADCQWPWSACDDILTVMVNRPRDISFAITQLLVKNSTRGELLFQSIDPERIAAGGHSIGGYATYALTGGDDLVCDALWPSIVGQDTLPYPPSTCVPTYPDRRIKAMVSLDGSSWGMRYHELARIYVPSLIMGETVDQLVQIGILAGMPDPEQIRSYNARPHSAIDRLSSYRADVNGANHYSFANYCDGLNVMYEYGVLIQTADELAAWEASWPCTNTGLDAVTISSADEHEVVTKYMIAFLDVYFHNPDSAPWLDWWILTPEYALSHTPTVQFFNSEGCHATLPNNTYFTYRPYQTSSECDVAQKDPTGWFASDPPSNSSDPAVANIRAPKAQLLQPKKPL